MLDIVDNAIALTKGDSATFGVDITDDITKQPYEMQEGDVLVLTVRKAASIRSPVLVEKKLSMSTVFKFVPADTANLSDGDYKYDVELRSGEDIYTVIQCETLTLLPEVTIP